MSQQLLLSQAFDWAVQHHQAGHWPEAEQLYRQILAAQPQHAGALHYLGVMAQQRGRPAEAAALIRQALAVNPNYAEAHFNLGNVLVAQKQMEEAIACYRRALTVNPQYVEAHTNLGMALAELGRIDEAIACYREALALRPQFADAQYNLGIALGKKGLTPEALAAYRQVIAMQPNYANAYVNLGAILTEIQQIDEAIVAYRQALALQPRLAEAHYNLGVALGKQGLAQEALAAYRRALALQPNYPKAYVNLGTVLAETGRRDDALGAYRQALALDPKCYEAYVRLGDVHTDQGHLQDALAACRQAIALRPDRAAAYTTLGNVLKEQGLLDDALSAYRQAMALEPTNTDPHSNVLLTMHYHPGYGARAMAAEHRRWNQAHAVSLRPAASHYPNDPDPDRRLRLGYVSPDFYGHPAGRFMVPLLEHHDKKQVEVFAYAHVPAPDALTARLRAGADHWHNIVGPSDQHIAARIREDRIDILVDLAMHTGSNLLLVFARKPAPVQVTYLAYCSTTGLETIDYRLSDPYLDPPDMDESIYSEKTARLPETYWCYQPGEVAPPVQPLPVLGRGHVTFGCLNNFCKVSEAALAVWTRVLRAVPQSHLLVHAAEGPHRRRVQERLERDGIEPARLQFVGRRPFLEYYRLYDQIDIALDPFPFGGGTTTCDGLWMGVPAVTLIGQTAVGRGGWSILSNIGLPELAAASADEYVRIATDLARDIPRLKHLRATLRQRVAGSPLMDAPRFARHVEAAYRGMWQAWCARAPET